MFVRWKTRKLAGEEGIGLEKTSLYAVLVENHRIDGKTRQKVVRYLGYINEAHINNPIHQSRFWQQVEHNMSGLNLNATEQLGLAAKISDRVPRPMTAAPLSSMVPEAVGIRYAVHQ